MLSCWSVNRFSLHAPPSLPNLVPSPVPLHAKLSESVLCRFGVYLYRLSNGGGTVKRPYVYYSSCTWFIQMPLLYAIRVFQLLLLWFALCKIDILCRVLLTELPYQLKSTTTTTTTVTDNLLLLHALLFVFLLLASVKYEQHSKDFIGDLNRSLYESVANCYCEGKNWWLYQEDEFANLHAWSIICTNPDNPLRMSIIIKMFYISYFWILCKKFVAFLPKGYNFPGWKKIKTSFRKSTSSFLQASSKRNFLCQSLALPLSIEDVVIASSIKYQNFWLNRNKNLWMADIMIALTFHAVGSSIKYQNFWWKGNKNTICFDWYCYFIWLSRALVNNSEDDVSLVGPTVFNYGKTDELKLVNKRFYVEDFTKSFSCDQICFSYQATY